MQRFIAAGLGLAMMSGTAAADGHSNNGPRIYAYKGGANYCPEGLQPVTISGVICCGTPNQSISYQQALAHPRAKKKHVRARSVSARADCQVGTKGCTFD